MTPTKGRERNHDGRAPRPVERIRPREHHPQSHHHFDQDAEREVPHRDVRIQRVRDHIEHGPTQEHVATHDKRDQRHQEHHAAQGEQQGRVRLVCPAGMAKGRPVYRGVLGIHLSNESGAATRVAAPLFVSQRESLRTLEDRGVAGIDVTGAEVDSDRLHVDREAQRKDAGPDRIENVTPPESRGSRAPTARSQAGRRPCRQARSWRADPAGAQW